jgi:hypothetical protein
MFHIVIILVIMKHSLSTDIIQSYSIKQFEHVFASLVENANTPAFFFQHFGDENPRAFK